MDLTLSPELNNRFMVLARRKKSQKTNDCRTEITFSQDISHSLTKQEEIQPNFIDLSNYPHAHTMYIHHLIY